MMKLFENVVANVLTAVYQPFWCAVVMSILCMYMYLIVTDKSLMGGVGWKKAVLIWINSFRKDRRFRSVFLLVFYSSMILFRTLLNRNMWMNPVSRVMGGWGLYVVSASTGEPVLTTECIENFIMFIPFTFMLTYIVQEKRMRKGFGNTLIFCLKWAAIVSITIEMLQLFLRVGTFQFSDIFYNSLGGAVGGLFYMIYRLIKEGKKT